MDNNAVSGNTFTTSLKIEFLNWARAFDLTIKRPREDVVFTTVRIPYPLTLFAPLKAGSKNLALAAQKDETEYYIGCNLDKNSACTFDRRTVVDLTNEMDGYYHILSRTFLRKHYDDLWFSAEAKKNPGSPYYVAKVVFAYYSGGTLYNPSSNPLEIILDRDGQQLNAVLQYSNGTKINEWKPVINTNHMTLVDPGFHILDIDSVQYGSHSQFNAVELTMTKIGGGVPMLRMYFDGKEILLLLNPAYKYDIAGICSRCPDCLESQNSYIQI